MTSCTLIACSPQAHSPLPGKDVVVVRSPDQRFEAVVREVNIDGSVMVSQPYQVLVRSLTVDSQNRAEVLFADKADGFRLRWNTSGQLDICYGKAQIHRFTNSFVALGRSHADLVEAEIVLTRSNSLAECEALFRARG